MRNEEDIRFALKNLYLNFDSASSHDVLVSLKKRIDLLEWVLEDD